jgi:hypothetical protein
VTLVRYLTKIVINHFGYDVRRVARPDTVHIADAGANPITFEYIRDKRGYAVLEVPIADLRGFHALALRLQPDCHPFVRAIDQALRQTGDTAARDTIEAVLRCYYQQVRPANAAEVVGLGWDDLPTLAEVEPRTSEHPIDASFLPWDARTPSQITESRRRTAIFEGLQNRRLGKLEHGVTSFGPLHPDKLSLEIDRLFRLAKSVKSRGFIRFDPRSPLQVSALLRDGRYTWLINSGQHRFAAAAALKIETLPAMVTRLVRRDDAPYWPQVVSGRFTLSGARSLFDRIFDGVPSPAASQWLQVVQTG